MTDPLQLIVRTTVNGATAEIRSVLPVANEEEARRARNELLRLSTEIAFKYGFDLKPVELANLQTLKEKLA